MGDATKTLELILKSRNGLDVGLNAGRASIRTFVDGSVGHFSRLATSVLNIRNLLAAGLAGYAGRAVFRPTIEMQDFVVQYRNLTGSVDTARAKIEQLMAFSDVTPFEPEPVIRAGMMLDRFTRGAEDTLDMVRLVGDAAAGTGAQFDELGMWIGRSYAMIAGGQPIGEATRRMLELGVITPQVKTEIERLQATNSSAAEVWGVLRKALEAHTGSMERLSQTTGGRISTLKGLWTGLRRDIGEGAIPALDRAIEDLIGTIQNLREGDTLARYGERAAAALGATWDAVRSLASFVQEHREALSTLGMTYIGYRLITSATAAIAAARTVVLSYAAAQTAAAASTSAHTAAMTAQTAAAGRLTAALGLTRAALLAIGPAAIAAGVALDAVLAKKLGDAVTDIAESKARAGLRTRSGFSELFRLWGMGDLEEGTGPASELEVKMGRRDRAKRLAAEAAKKAAAPGPGGISGAEAPDAKAAEKAAKEAADAFERDMAERRRLHDRRQALLDEQAQRDADAAQDRVMEGLDAELEALETAASERARAIGEADDAARAAKAAADQAFADLLLPPDERRRAGRREKDENDARRKLERDIADARRKQGDERIHLGARDRALIAADDKRLAAAQAEADAAKLRQALVADEKAAQDKRDERAAAQLAFEQQRETAEQARHVAELAAIDELIAALGAMPGMPGAPAAPGASPGGLLPPGSLVQTPAGTGTLAGTVIGTDAGRDLAAIKGHLASLDRKITGEGLI